jgi:acylphosphatase
LADTWRGRTTHLDGRPLAPRYPASMVREHVWVSGLVQGVFFRYEARQRARSWGLGGWIRNLPDGRVEAVFEGPRDAAEAMVDWCRTGPRGAEVSEVEVVSEEPEGLVMFEVRP